MARTVRIAAAQYPIDEVTTFAAFESKLSRWVGEAVAHGAQLLVFPEYAAMELSRIAGRHISRDLHISIESLQYYIKDYEEVHAKLARTHGVCILAGSMPVRLVDGTFVNRARLFAPGGKSGFQQKHVMTRFEREDWGISPSLGLCVFDTGAVKVGLAICYDAEFPVLVRAIAEAGADIVLVPSCTDTLSGYHRVKVACAARALENQIYVVQSATVGEAAWSAALDVNIGAAGVFAPPDRLFPADGVIAHGILNEARWVYATLDLDLLAAVRKDGEVRNALDWPLQPGASKIAISAKTVDLT